MAVRCGRRVARVEARTRTAAATRRGLHPDARLPLAVAAQRARRGRRRRRRRWRRWPCHRRRRQSHLEGHHLAGICAHQVLTIRARRWVRLLLADGVGVPADTHAPVRHRARSVTAAARPCALVVLSRDSSCAKVVDDAIACQIIRKVALGVRPLGELPQWDSVALRTWRAVVDYLRARYAWSTYVSRAVGEQAAVNGCCVPRSMCKWA